MTEAAGGSPIRIPLSSFSWEKPVAKDAPLEQLLLAERTPPKAGAGTLIIATLVTTQTPFKALCGKGTGPAEVVVETPMWEERFTDGELHYQKYKLKNVTVTACGHTEGAAAEAFHLQFTDIEEMPLTEKPVPQATGTAQ